MNDLLAQFQGYLLHEKRVALNTYYAHVRDLKQFMHFVHARAFDVKTITQREIKEFLLYLKKDQGNSASSLARKVFTIKHFFIWAHEHAGLANPMTGITISRDEKKTPNYLTEQDVQKLCTVARDDASLIGKRNALLIVLLYSTGLRVSQLVQLTLSSFDIHHGCILMYQQGVMLTITLDSDVRLLMNEYIETVYPKLTHNRLCPFLFPVLYKNVLKPLSRQSAWLIIHELAKKASLTKSVSPQQLKYFCALQRLKRGADLSALKKLVQEPIAFHGCIDHDMLRSVYDKKHPRS